MGEAEEKQIHDAFPDDEDSADNDEKHIELPHTREGPESDTGVDESKEDDGDDDLEHPQIAHDEPKAEPPRTQRLQFTRNPFICRIHSIVLNVVCRRRMSKSAAISICRLMCDPALGPAAMTSEGSKFMFKDRRDFAAYIKQRIPSTKLGIGHASMFYDF